MQIQIAQMNGNDSPSTVAIAIEPMLKIREVPPEAQLELAIRKLDFCGRCPANWHFFVSSAKGEESRKMSAILPICVEYLEELIEYFGTTNDAICQRIYPPLFEVVNIKIYGDLRPPIKDETQWAEEAEEKLPKEDGRQQMGDAGGVVEHHHIEWRHSKAVYDLFIVVLESTNFRVTQTKDFVDQPFVRHLITNLINSPQSGERHCLVRIIRRIYTKFVRLRPHIRKHLIYALEEVLFDERSQLATTKTFYGIAEMLDVLENVVNGFKVPLKDEEEQMFAKVLLPLHKIDSLDYFYKNLIERVLQFVELDPPLALVAIDKMLKWWPKANGQKESIFVEELELIITRVEDQRLLKRYIGTLFARLAKCIASQNFQVSIKVLHFWRNERILHLIKQNSAQIIQIFAEPLRQTAKNHWNKKIQSEAKIFQNILMEVNWKEYNRKMVEITEGCKEVNK